MNSIAPDTKHSGRRSRRARNYVLYAGPDGEPRNHWQYWGVPKVPGCTRSDEGDLLPPEFRWVVRARSARQACYYALIGERATGEDDLGVLWDRNTDHGPPPPAGHFRRSNGHR